MKQTLTILAVATVLLPFGLAETSMAQSGSRNVAPPRQAPRASSGSSTRTQPQPSSGSSSRAQPQASNGSSTKAKMMEGELGLDGYCVVCVHNMKKWEKGDPSITSVFDGFEYRFPSQAIKAEFDRDPQAFVPVLQGDCIVCLEKMDKRVPGKVQFPTLYNGRLYLFPGAGEKAAFDASPDQFVDADLALGGDCAVCLAKMGKNVPGSPEFTVIHNGMRYQFPSESEAEMFRQQPSSFVAVGSSKADIASRN